MDLWAEGLLHGAAWRWNHNKWLHAHLWEVSVELDGLHSSDKRADNPMGYEQTLFWQLQLPLDHDGFIEDIVRGLGTSDLWPTRATLRVVRRWSNPFRLLLDGSWGDWVRISWSETNFIALRQAPELRRRLNEALRIVKVASLDEVSRLVLQSWREILTLGTGNWTQQWW